MYTYVYINNIFIYKYTRVNEYFYNLKKYLLIIQTFRENVSLIYLFLKATILKNIYFHFSSKNITAHRVQ